MQHTNRLINSTSPYLLQHAHNPVDWHPYGDEALTKAREGNKPLIISIGYSACHWCHVMEHESFENEQVAAFMNEHFICIKVDREERPDIDNIYMEAVQVLTGSGGWPLNVFCMPDGKPFYGGTYFPAHAAHNRPSWMQVLTSINESYTTKQDEMQAYANDLLQHVDRSSRFYKVGTNESDAFHEDDIHTTFKNVMSSADRIWGGFGGAPKFPSVMTLQFLLRYHFHYNNADALQHVLHSVRCMLHGGIYDHLAGGFARYSTDKYWLAPHFEKMLYDNALLLQLLAECYSITHEDEFKQAIYETIGFVKNNLTSPEGGFYSALDADSEGEEGKYYVWTKQEVDSILGADADISASFCKYYDITETGNWEGVNILHTPMSLTDFCTQEKLDIHATSLQFKECREKLLQQRVKRIAPGLDDKILLGWNALMASALCKCYTATGEKDFKQMAVNNIHFVLKAFADGAGNMLHTYKNGIKQYAAFLDDYAFLTDALINVYTITGDISYINKAGAFAEYVLTHFADSTDGSFYYTSDRQTDVIMRKKEFFDNAIPAGSSTMVFNLVRLSVYLNKADWYDKAMAQMHHMKEAVCKYPTSFAVWASTLLFITKEWREVVIAGTGAETTSFELQKSFMPDVLWAYAEQTNDTILFEGRDFTTTNTPNIYICRNMSCLQPVTSIKEAFKILLAI